MGKSLVAACLLLAACQGMYSSPSDPLKAPRRIKRPATSVAATEVPYIDDCTVDFTGRVATKRKTREAQTLVTSGNAALQSSGGSAVPATPREASAAVDAVAKYRDALIADPYNAEATLKLALAYDHTLRKGCALAMLKRLSALAENDKLSVEAEPEVQLVLQNDHWFRGYRPAALKAIGH